MKTYLFFRKDSLGQSVWYPIECKDDDAAKVQAEMNPGTVRVERIHPSGKSTVVWRQQ